MGARAGNLRPPPHSHGDLLIRDAAACGAAPRTEARIDGAGLPGEDPGQRRPI